ncbi:MAG: hypothetical protein IT314_08270 [Anaerolineales bacterium]|nr:hypothetical protein [Anaerolineales bacterium]
MDALPDYNLTLAPDANIKGIYWDIIISHLGDAISKSIPENQATLAKVLEKFPEYGGIGHGADYKIKQAFMQAFLKESGGKMIITDMNWRRFEADFNQEIKLEVIHGNRLPQEYAGAMRENINDKHGRGGGFTMYVSEQGQVVYSVMFVNNTLDYTLEENEGSLYNIGNWTAGEITSDFFRKLVANTAMHSRVDLRTVNASNYKLYIKGADPDSGEFFASMYWTFIK